MKRILVAGASGLIGREVVRILKSRGAWVRTLSRRPEAAEPLRGVADEVVLADATEATSLRGVCDGIDVVCSSLGAAVLPSAKEKRSFAVIDRAANLNLVAEAQRARVKRFVYVSVYTTDAYADTPYIRAHADVERALSESGMEHATVRPTGVFGAMTELVRMASTGRLPLIGDGHAKTNPVHESDVAELVVDAALAATVTNVIDVGGPDVLSRDEIVTLAFQAVGRPRKVVRAPAWALRLAATLFAPFNPRSAEFLRFIIEASVSSCIAPQRGTRHLAVYLAEYGKGLAAK